MTLYKELAIPSDGALSFVFRKEPDHTDCYLDLYGTPLYLISVACETCAAIFKRVRDLQVPIAPQELCERFAVGVQIVSDEIIQTVTPLLPKGEYIVGLVELLPARAQRTKNPQRLGCQSDYFWWRLFRERECGIAYELILPFVPEKNLSADWIAWYRARLKRGHKPTALALSMINERALMGEYNEWALVHYLLDGHHKIMAASQIGYPITLLSFLRETDLFRDVRRIDTKLRAYYGGSAFDKVEPKF